LQLVAITEPTAYAGGEQPETATLSSSRSHRSVPDLALIVSAPLAVAAGGGVGLLVTALLLGFRHGIDWDHIAAITDITSTTAASTAGEARHETEHRSAGGHVHEHGGAGEL